MNNTGRTLLALFAGAAAGAVLGILFAPDKGSETRRKIADSTGRLTDSIKESAEEGMNTLSEVKDKVYSKAEELSGKVQEMVGQGKTEAERFRNSMEQPQV